MSTIVILMLFALALAGDLLTTHLAIAAGAVESNAIYGRNPNMKLMLYTHVGMLLAMAAILYADPRLGSSGPRRYCRHGARVPVEPRRLDQAEPHPSA